MLEFIVLGQIPGTHIQITISWFIVGIFVVYMWFDWNTRHHIAASQAGSKKLNKQKLLSTRHLAARFHRTASTLQEYIAGRFSAKN